jgi:hypothetical protein
VREKPVDRALVHQCQPLPDLVDDCAGGQAGLRSRRELARLRIAGLGKDPDGEVRRSIDVRRPALPDGDALDPLHQQEAALVVARNRPRDGIAAARAKKAQGLPFDLGTPAAVALTQRIGLEGERARVRLDTKNPAVRPHMRGGERAHRLSAQPRGNIAQHPCLIRVQHAGGSTAHPSYCPQRSQHVPSVPWRPFAQS